MKSMLIFLLLISFATGGFLFLQRETMKPMDIIYLGAMIVIVGGVIGAYGTLMHNRSSSEKSTRIETGVKSTSDEVKKVQEQNQALKVSSEILTAKVDEQAQVIDILRKENNELSSKLSSETLKIYNNLMGAGSFPVVGIIPISSDSGFYWIRNNGETPLYDVSYTIRDTDVFRKGKTSMEDVKSATIYLEVGTVIAKDLSPGVIKANFKGSTKLFDIYIKTRNGYFFEKLLLMKMNGVWISEITVYDNKNKIVHKSKKEHKFETF